VQACVERLERQLAFAMTQTTLVIPIDASVELRSGDARAALEPWDLALISGASDDVGGLVLREPFRQATVFVARGLTRP
jgi:hypothetical protein